MELVLLFGFGFRMLCSCMLVSLLNDVKEVVAVSTVSWDEKVLLLEDVFAE